MQKHRQREATILCPLLSFVLLPTMAHADWPGVLVEQYKDAIVYIDATFKEPKEGERPRHEHGIGFVISPSGYVLTANRAKPAVARRLER